MKRPLQSVSKPDSKKRGRIIFTPEQKEKLESCFAKNPYPNEKEFDEISATQIKLDKKHLKCWFGHRRARKAKADKSTTSQLLITLATPIQTNVNPVSTMILSPTTHPPMPTSNLFTQIVTDLEEYAVQHEHDDTLSLSMPH
jgi:hypothetical protein